MISSMVFLRFAPCSKLFPGVLKMTVLIGSEPVMRTSEHKREHAKTGLLLLRIRRFQVQLLMRALEFHASSGGRLDAPVHECRPGTRGLAIPLSAVGTGGRNVGAAGSTTRQGIHSRQMCVLGWTVHFPGLSLQSPGHEFIGH